MHDDERYYASGKASGGLVDRFRTLQSITPFGVRFRILRALFQLLRRLVEPVNVALVRIRSKDDRGADASQGQVGMRD